MRRYVYRVLFTFNVSHPICSAAVLQYAEEILPIYQCVLGATLTEQAQSKHIAASGSGH